MTRPKDRFVETLSEVPATCLKENENGNLCTRSEGHDGEHKAVGPKVRGKETWTDGGPVTKTDFDGNPITEQTTLPVATDGGE